jgi:hypothetical protein
MIAAIKYWFRKKRERREKLTELFAESRRLEHREYDLRVMGEYMGEPLNQERARLTSSEQWASYEKDCAALLKAKKDNDAEIEKVLRSQ